MPQHVRLSNGAALDIPDGTNPADIRSRVDQAEAVIKAQPSAGDSFTHELARRAVGAYQLFHNYIEPVAGSAGRVAGAGADLFPPVGMYDFAASGLNAAKPILAEKYPSLRNTPNMPILSDLATQGVGAPPLPADAPWWQRYGEGALTGATQGLKTAGKFVASQATGDIGQSVASRFGGPDWSQFGRWLGGLPGAMPDKLIGEPARAIIAKTAGPQAPEVDAAATQLNTQATPGALATPPMRLAIKGLNAMPVAYLPVLIAQQTMDDAIRDTRNTSAEDINRGPLPVSTDQGTIGSNLINLARTKSASIKADAKGRFQDLDNAVGPSTLVDSRPVVAAIQQLMRDPRASAGQIQALQARIDYLNSMTVGQPYYTGPALPPNVRSPGAIPLGQLSQFRSELGADLQGMPELDTVLQGKARDAVTDSMNSIYQQRGYGAQWAQANDFYKMNIGAGTPTAALDAVGGTPVKGKPGLYDGGMDAQAAYSFLKGHTMSHDELEPFVDANSPYWRGAAAQFVNSLGQGKQGADDFRADTFGSQMHAISPEVLSQLTQAQGGGPLQPTMANLRAAEVLGNNSSVPVSRMGLTNAIGSLAALSGFAAWLGHNYSEAGLPAGVAVPLTLAAGNYALHSKPVTDAMAGRTTSTPLVDAFYQALPIASSATNLDDRQAQPTDTPRPRSPLDQLNQPNQFLPPKPGAPPPTTLPPGAPAPNPFAPPNMNPPPVYNF